MMAHKIKPSTVEISSGLIKSVKRSRGKYQIHLDDKKVEAAKAKKSAEKETLNRDIKDLEKKAKSLHETAEYLETEFAKCCKSAEVKRDKNLLSKGNALKRKADEKHADMNIIVNTINELKNKKI